MTPVIGITTYEDRQASWRDWSARAAMLPYVYVDAVRRGGGRAVLLPPGGGDEEASATVASLDGLLVTGGPDMNPVGTAPARHPRHAGPHDTPGRVGPGRHRPRAATRRTAARHLPRHAGTERLPGRLHCTSTCPNLVGHGRHDGPPNGLGLHQVRISPDSTLATILPEDGFIEMPTHHHQAVNLLGDGLKAAAGRRTAPSRRSRPGRPSSAGSPASCSVCSGTQSRAPIPACSPRSSGRRPNGRRRSGPPPRARYLRL